jgi:hypothetical protein
MRTLGLVLLLAACGDNTANNPDLSIETLGDMSATPDMTMNCAPAMSGDGNACGGGNVCPSGQIGFISGAGCTCLYKCTPGKQSDCACDRSCVTLSDADGGVVGGACVPGKTAGFGCANDCAQGLTCSRLADGSDMKQPKYCIYDCSVSTDCPAQTSCIQITNSSGAVIGMACEYGYGMSGKAPGATCDPQTDVCTTGYLCDGTCKVQCDPGPTGAACAGGTNCQKLTDSKKNKTIGYVCK